MVMNTIMVGAAVTPGVIETAISHYTSARKTNHGKPTAHISYDQGLGLVRHFLNYSAHHTVEDLQAFTAQWVPYPRYIKVSEVVIPAEFLDKAATYLQAQLGPTGINAVGGEQWWQWRPKKTPLRAEWIEMRKDYNARKISKGPKNSRIMMYIHGGAYYFGSVDEHRYQMQRHARKLGARLLAPRYRLAPQFPFPCGLLDAMACYLFLLDQHDPSSILLAGDSAGAGMIVSLLVMIRDQGLALPAGAILISPWVDLTHSFPSLSGDDSLDYIPAHGFHHRPSAAWMPPRANDSAHMKTEFDAQKGKVKVNKEAHFNDGLDGFKVGEEDGTPEVLTPILASHAEITPNISVNVDGKRVEVLDQIQLYTTNQLLSHPLVSSVVQPSLGGLCPLLIQTGGGELLRDEQIYLAHKAANPLLYPPPQSILDVHDPSREIMHKYPPTKVQLQVWEDLCHVPHTLSFTTPAKHMYRAVAQFGNWAYSHSQKETVNSPQLDDDANSIVSSTSSTSSFSSAIERPSSSRSRRPRSLSQGAQPSRSRLRQAMSKVSLVTASETIDGLLEPWQYPKTDPQGQVSALEPLPHFSSSMIRQLITRSGAIYPLPHISRLPALNQPVESIAQIKPGPVRRWFNSKSAWDKKYASTKRKVLLRRQQELKSGYVTFTSSDGKSTETPPPTALAGRRLANKEDLNKPSRKSTLSASVGLKATTSLAEKAGLKKENKSLGEEAAEEGLYNLGPAVSGKKKSWGMSLWSGWGSKHDAVTVEAANEDTGDESCNLVDGSSQATSPTVSRPISLNGSSTNLANPGTESRMRRSHTPESGNSTSNRRSLLSNLVTPKRLQRLDKNCDQNSDSPVSMTNSETSFWSSHNITSQTSNLSLDSNRPSSQPQPRPQTRSSSQSRPQTQALNRTSFREDVHHAQSSMLSWASLNKRLSTRLTSTSTSNRESTVSNQVDDRDSKTGDQIDFDTFLAQEVIEKQTPPKTNTNTPQHPPVDSSDSPDLGSVEINTKKQLWMRYRPVDPTENNPATSTGVVIASKNPETKVEKRSCEEHIVGNKLERFVTAEENGRM